MKRFRIAAAVAALCLALTAGAFAAGPGTAPPVVTPKGEGEKVAAPVLDLMFCIDTSPRMEAHLPYVKVAIQSLIRREKARYPGHTVRLGLAQYVYNLEKPFVSNKHVVLNLSEHEEQFLEALQQTECVEATQVKAPALAGDLTPEYTHGVTWSERGVRRLYVFGNGLPFKTGGREWDIAEARKQNVLVSAAYCSSRPFGDPKISDEWNVRDWIFVELTDRGSWMEIAHYTGGEFIQLFSHKDGTAAPTPTGRPLLGVIWEPVMASEFNEYVSRPPTLSHLSFDQFLNTNLRARFFRKTVKVVPGSIPINSQGYWISNFSNMADIRAHFPGNEARVIRYFEEHPSSATYLLRP